MWPSSNLCSILWSWPDRSALPWSLLAALGGSCVPSVSFSWPSFYPTVAHVYPLLKLACTDTTRIGLLVIANSGLLGLVTSVVLLISYSVILSTVRSYSVENRRKALSTCSSQQCGGPLFCSFILHLHSTSNYFTRRQSVWSFLYYHCSHAQSSNLHTEKLGDEEWHKEILVPYHSKKENELKDTSDFHRWTWLNIWIFYNEDFKMYNACLICFFVSFCFSNI